MIEGPKVHYRYITLFYFKYGKNAYETYKELYPRMPFNYACVINGFCNFDLEVFEIKMLLAPDDQPLLNSTKILTLQLER